MDGMPVELGPTLREKRDRLAAWFRDAGAVVVAFSGGTDSALVLAIAREVLGERCVGVTAFSASMPGAEMESAAATARLIGARHEVIESKETEDPDYRRNDPDRCYFCKSDVYSRITAHAAESGGGVIVDGTNADDLADHRPGLRAAREKGVRSPLQEVGLTKEEIRLLSRAMDLPTWDKPAAACLSSRIPYGTSVTPELLSTIEQAEGWLRELGLRQLRVRHHDKIARIEINPEDFGIVIRNRDRIARRFHELGYRFVTLDLEGFRSGSMNAGIVVGVENAAPSRADGLERR